MRYFRDSLYKYDTEYMHAWRLNDNGSVEFRDDLLSGWFPANILSNRSCLEDSIMAGDIEEIAQDPFTEYDCPSHDN